MGRVGPTLLARQHEANVYVDLQCRLVGPQGGHPEGAGATYPGEGKATPVSSPCGYGRLQSELSLVSPPRHGRTRSPYLLAIHTLLLCIMMTSENILREQIKLPVWSNGKDTSILFYLGFLKFSTICHPPRRPTGYPKAQRNHPPGSHSAPKRGLRSSG